MTDESFLLQRVQPAMVGLVDGSLATLAPIFAVALATHKPHYAFVAGLASALAAGVLDGVLRGSLGHRGADGPRTSGDARCDHGRRNLHRRCYATLPFLIPHYEVALVAALIVVALEMLGLAWIAASDERGFLVARSNPARVLAAIGLGLQIPYLVWYVLGLRTDVWRIHVEWGKKFRTNPDGYWDIPFFDLLSTLLLVLCVVLAAISLLVRSRAIQRALLGGAVAAFVLSIAGYLVHVSRYSTDYGVPSFPFTSTLKVVLGFGDYTYPVDYPDSFPHVYWGEFAQISLLASTLGAIFLLAAFIVTLVARREQPTTSEALASVTG